MKNKDVKIALLILLVCVGIKVIPIILVVFADIIMSVIVFFLQRIG